MQSPHIRHRPVGIVNLSNRGKTAQNQSKHKGSDRFHNWDLIDSRDAPPSSCGAASSIEAFQHVRSVNRE
jgi:hypothetical protein